jgi:hypothetical protein
MSLAKLSYSDLHHRLKDLTSSELLALLDDRSNKVGDTAVELLSSRDEGILIHNSILSDELKTKKGKVRAMHCLKRYGRRMPEAIEAYLHLIHDGNPDVVAAALFGVVFWNDPSNINRIRNIRNPRAQLEVEKAVAALVAGDPSLYSPGFLDVTGVWKSTLDE